MVNSDIEHFKKIDSIMADAEKLAGKEFIDYILEFLKGKKDEELPELTDEQVRYNRKINRKQIVYHPLGADELKKLTKILADDNMIYYFSVNEGFKVLIDSLYFGTGALDLIETTLEKQKKLQEDIQRQHQYEALIDFMTAQNQNAEGKTMSQADMLKILHILETGSLNEIVRSNLSDKKKIKDLFLVVIRSIDIAKNK